MLVALVESIAATAGVSESHVTVTRQIQSISGQDGNEQICELSYVITLPPDESGALTVESNRIKAAFGLTKNATDANIEEMTSNLTTRVGQVVGSGAYSIQVTSISIPEVQTEVVQPTTTLAPRKDEDKEDRANKARIIGGIVGAFAVLMVASCCVLACCYVRRRQMNKGYSI